MTTTLQELDEVLENKEGNESDDSTYPIQLNSFDAKAGDFLRNHATEIRAALELRQGWQPIETAPEESEFLVYMPNELRRIQVARRTKKIMVIGSNFDFELTKPTRWMPLPAPPAQGEEG